MRDYLLGVVTPLIAVSCIVLPHPVLADDAAKPVEAKLVAKGDGYLVHVLPGRPAPVFPFGLPKRFGVLNQNAAVIHTSTKTGKMQCLFASGHSSALGPPMGIDRIYHVKWRLLGTSVSDDHLFLLTWHADAAVMRTGRPLPPPRFGKGQYSLSVFNASDGNKLTSIKHSGDHLPESPPPETNDSGPLQVEGDKVTVFKQVFQFDGKQLRPAN
jgi:hypothetical protein